MTDPETVAAVSEQMTDEQLNKLATIRWEQPGLVVSGFDATAEIRQLRRELAEAKAFSVSADDKAYLGLTGLSVTAIVTRCRKAEFFQGAAERELAEVKAERDGWNKNARETAGHCAELLCKLDTVIAERDAARRECESWKQAVDNILPCHNVGDRIRREAERLIEPPPSGANNPP